VLAAWPKRCTRLPSLAGHVQQLDVATRRAWRRSGATGFLHAEDRGGAGRFLRFG